MNNEANSSWPSMVPSSGDEFASFIDLPDLDIDSSNLDNGASAGEHVEDGQSELRNHYGQHTFFGGDVGAHEEGMIPRSASATDINMLKRISGLQVQPGSYPQAEHHTQFGSQAMQFHHQGVIPPTPTSLDIHGNRSHFNTIDAQQQTMYDAQLRKQQQEVSTTSALSGTILTHERWSSHLWEHRQSHHWISSIRCPNMPSQVNTSVRSHHQL